MRTNDKLQTLKLCAAFRSADAATLGMLAEIMTVERFEAGETVFEYGEPAIAVIIVAEGRLSAHLPDRDEPIRIMGPGEVAGEYGLFADAIRTATLRAVEQTVLLSIDYQRFGAFLREFPDALFQLMQTTVARLTELERRVEGADLG